MNKNIKLNAIIFIVISTFSIVILHKIITNQTQKFIEQRYNNVTLEYKGKVKQLVDEKKKSTLLIAIALSQNKNLKDALTNKNSQCLEIDKFTQLAKKHTVYKNIWIQIIDDKGNSFYRSWVLKRGDSLLKARVDVNNMIKEPKIMNTISTGKFDMTFKSMVPIYNEKKFLGMIEIITHFNSIAKNIENENIKPIVFVDKKYKKQLTKAFTKIFVNDNYIANLNANKKLLNKLRSVKDIDKIIQAKNFIFFENYIVTTYKINDIYDNPMGYFTIFIDKNSIDIKDIRSVENSIKIIVMTAFILIALIFLFFYFYRYSKKVEEINKILKQRVEKDLEIIRKKDSILIQQSRQAAMGEMIGNIAHQWRQPLNALGLTVQKIKMFYDEDMLTSQNLDKSIDKSIMLINKMSTTIDDFRNFFKTDKLKKEFNVKEAIDEVLNLIDASLNNNNITMDISNVDENTILLGYKNELEQVLLNIINNAKDALVEQNICDKSDSTSCHQKPKIEIKTSLLKDNIYIVIADNAGGIPHDIINKIFEPYFTTKGQGKGTGIGLYMSKMIIENNMDGELSVQNSEDGAIFTIKL